MNRLSKFFKSPLAEKVLLVEAFLLVAAVGLVLRLVPFRFLKKSLSKRLSAKIEEAPADWLQINKIVRSVKLSSRFVPFATCLAQSLAALLLIKLKGQHSVLKIGVTKDEKQHFKAHAWLETNGRIIIGKLPSHRQYTVLDSLFE
jgi:hypothetical protein